MKDEIRMSEALIYELDRIIEFAELRRRCKRKAVGCSLVNLFGGKLRNGFVGTNGPAHLNAQCSGEIGSCGCAHAEPALIVAALRAGYRKGFVMVCTYSPCVTCANLIICSGLIHGVVRDIFTQYPQSGLLQHDMRGEQFLISAGIDVITKEDLEKSSEKALASLRKWKLISPVC